MKQILDNLFIFKDMKKKLKFISLAMISVLVLASCEGPMGPIGPVGPEGPEGPQGPEANAACAPCHKPVSVDSIYFDYDRFAAHSGTTLRTGGGGACAVCHTQEGFVYAAKNNVSSIPTAINSNISKPFNCYTCHSDIHTKYDWSLTTTAPVKLEMWQGTKTADIKSGNSSSNLCLRCHQPRSVTGIGNILSNLGAINTTLGANPAYSAGIHYNSGQVLAAGVGGIEFVGSEAYKNSSHVAATSCATCHMPKKSSLPGYLGHRFGISGNYDACATCHQGMTAGHALNTGSKAAIETLIGQLADKLKNVVGSGNDIVMPNGNLSVYNATNNPAGYWGAPGNLAFSTLTLTNAQFGAIINYQLVARSAGARSGAHNFPYVKALLQNSIEALN